MIRLEHFSFTYSGASQPVLKDLNVEVDEGEFVLLVGLSGSGKSTLCRAMNGLIPHFYGGTIAGRATVDGIDIRNTSPAKLAGTVGMVFQDPENQLIMTNVENELAFGMENLSLPRSEMRERVSRYADYFDLHRFFPRFIPELSGGEKQKVALASIIAMRPKYIVLDEPTSQLDEETSALFLDHLEKLNREEGIGVILVEHRLERCFRFAKRIVYMKDGRIGADGCPSDVRPLLFRDGLMAEIRENEYHDERSDPIIVARGLTFSYGNGHVLDGLDLEVRRGEVLAIIGSNGCGKSTLLKHLNGILRPQSGNVQFEGRNIVERTTASLANCIGYLGQNPNNYLFADTLDKELDFTLSHLKIEKSQWEERKEWALRVLSLEMHRETFPRELSCGERERAALASILVGRPRILVLDEPTRGLDHGNKAKLASIIHGLQGEGMTTILVTHDYRFVAEHATRVQQLHGGKLENMPMESVMSKVKNLCSEA
jgi:energy-coupling factor transporter ATP-binding protein EcfA2